MSAVKEDITRGAQTESMPLPNGPAAAAILAGGIGTAWYGLMVVLSAASKGFSDFLNWYPPVGPLSGKTTMGVIGWLAAWFILAKAYKGKDVDVNKIWTIALALIVVGLLFTFPPVFDIFAP